MFTSENSSNLYIRFGTREVQLIQRNDVTLHAKFPCGPLDINSWVPPKLDMSNVYLFIYFIERIRLGT